MYVCNQREDKFFNSPEGIPNFLMIKVSFIDANVLVVTSKDYDRRNYKQWKTWSSQVYMTGHSGRGSYIYDIGNGIHEIVMQGDDKFVVRAIDTGKADWKNNTDNTPASQTWIRVRNNDPMLDRFKSMLPNS